MSQYEDITDAFTKEPDQVIKAVGIMKADYKEGQRIWVVTEEGKTVLIECLDED